MRFGLCGSLHPLGCGGVLSRREERSQSGEVPQPSVWGAVGALFACRFQRSHISFLSSWIAIGKTSGLSVFFDFILNQTVNSNQVDVRNATVGIGPLLKESSKTEVDTKKTPNWRVKEGNFVKQTTGRLCERGAINLSAGWFAQGHDVSLIFYSMKPNQI